ncbi:hypothetical protein G5I_03197 [Acromyrmex echinatior]|uniref:Uncharacterized protein n=1 Tax=Acromyrmex echinatior TaxID=103372 RepID=F4WCC3_ACREC|nr:hypothetical protein G5I_03197 [Acromyrmex echinatior]
MLPDGSYRYASAIRTAVYYGSLSDIGNATDVDTLINEHFARDLAKADVVDKKRDYNRSFESGKLAQVSFRKMREPSNYSHGDIESYRYITFYKCRPIKQQSNLKICRIICDTRKIKRKRATSAEKEIAALKEQLAATNDNNSKTEGHQLSQPPQGSDQQQVHDASNPRRTPNSNLEQELQAKDKEVQTEAVVDFTWRIAFKSGNMIGIQTIKLSVEYKAIQVDKSSRGNIEYELPATTRSLFSPGSGQEEPKW